MKIKEFGVETWINNYEKDCKYNLSGTCVGILSVEDLIKMTDDFEKILAQILDIELGYGEVYGSLKLRNNIASLYETAEYQNISIAHGAIGANSLAYLTLIESGDEIVSVLPVYEQHYSIPESINAKVKKIFLKEENGWQIDLNELENSVTKRTKMICLNNPNNPTGALIDDEILDAIVEIARKNDAYILCDEVYRGLSHHGNPFSRSIFDIYEKGISTGSLSKTFSLPGLRLGWIAAPYEVIRKINVQRDYHVICVGRINDYLASIALENKDRIIKNNHSICKKHLEMLDDWVNSEPGITYVKPKAGTTAFLKYDMNLPSKDLCLKLQNETGVMFLPGEVMEVENHLRMGYTGDYKTTQKALEIFSDWLKVN